MSDRAELLEATLDMLPEGAALLGDNCRVVFWNHAAQAITGYAPLDVVGRPAPDELLNLLQCPEPGTDGSRGRGHGFLVHARHKAGHDVAAMARMLPLRDGMGARIGTAVLFHPAECIDALPHGVTGECEGVEASQIDLEEQLQSLFEDLTDGGPDFGVLWITVDQAHELRRTHGLGACEAMFQKVERALVQGLRPAEHLGRWGEDEYLVISHERTPALLAEHAQTLAGLARTAEFRWWGDRISLTVSIGAAQAEKTKSLNDLLEQAKAAMLSSFQLGGNHITAAPGGHTCSPS